MSSAKFFLDLLRIHQKLNQVKGSTVRKKIATFFSPKSFSFFVTKSLPFYLFTKKIGKRSKISRKNPVAHEIMIHEKYKKPVFGRGRVGNCIFCIMIWHCIFSEDKRAAHITY